MTTIGAATARIIPFAVYGVFLVLSLGLEYFNLNQSLPFDERWLYAVKTICVAAALAWLWSHYQELHQARPSWQEGLLAVFVGLSVFVAWINLDVGWMMLGNPPAGYNPLDAATGRIDPTLAGFRLLGAVIVVPLMEELFWRSFVMRWVQTPDFLRLDPRRVGLRALLLSAILFGIEHHLWFAGVVAGLAYGWLYQRSANLWVPIVAHAVTNLALGIWVLVTAQWVFW